MSGRSYFTCLSPLSASRNRTELRFSIQGSAAFVFVFVFSRSSPRAQVFILLTDESCCGEICHPSSFTNSHFAPNFHSQLHCHSAPHNPYSQITLSPASRKKLYPFSTAKPTNLLLKARIPVTYPQFSSSITESILTSASTS